MPDGNIEKHQLAGFDERERGFNRPVECEAAGAGFRAVLRYETTLVAAEHPASPAEALKELVQVLHRQGYRQLRSQLSFQNGVYLGSQDPWIEYPDPPTEPLPAQGLWQNLVHWIHRIVATR
jgi:hypothetical protein